MKALEDVSRSSRGQPASMAAQALTVRSRPGHKSAYTFTIESGVSELRVLLLIIVIATASRLALDAPIRNPLRIRGA